MKLKVGHAIGFLVILAFSAYGFWALKESAMFGYSTFADARRANRPVQVAGFKVENSLQFDARLKAIKFKMKDTKGEVATVIFRGVKPANLEEANGLWVRGEFENGVFFASKILTG